MGKIIRIRIRIIRIRIIRKHSRTLKLGLGFSWIWILNHRSGGLLHEHALETAGCEHRIILERVSLAVFHVHSSWGARDLGLRGEERPRAGVFRGLKSMWRSSFAQKIMLSQMYKSKMSIMHFQTLYIRSVAQLNTNIVIVYKLKPPGHKRKTKDAL
jgi:hypothetical protein